MSYHSVIISDVHLCEAVEGDDLWMRYRRRQFFPDADFTQLFGYLRAKVGGEALEIVFNGDVFDFDAPTVKGSEVLFDATPAVTEARAVSLLSRILDDHRDFVGAVGQMLARGHRIVFVSGNHDVQLAFPGVQKVLADRLVRAAEERGATGSEATQRILFRKWFYVSPSRVHIEHGNQYDYNCSFRCPTEPFAVDGATIQPTMGSLAFRNMISRMGYFNAYVDSSFLLSVPQYLKHWIKYYLFTRRSLALAWGRGSLKSFLTTWRLRSRPDATRENRMLAEYATDESRPIERVRLHAALFEPPADRSLIGIFRTLWLDRATVFGAGSMLVLGGGVLSGWAAAVAMGLIAAVAIAGYVIATPMPMLNDVYPHVDAQQRPIARIYDARGVVFGHTHIPFGFWEDGIFFGNTGTWTVAFRDEACTQPVENGRPLVWLHTDETGALHGGLYRWRQGALTESA